MKILFDTSGKYLLGTHKGTHASELPMSFVEWASRNVDGFRKQYAALARGEALPVSRPPQVRPFSQNPPARKYFISKTPRMYQPKPTDE